MGAWLSASILMGGWVSTSIAMGAWYPGWYSPSPVPEENDKNNKTLVHILDCPLCLGNMKIGIIRCKYGQNKCKTCRPNVGLCPYWRESVRRQITHKNVDPTSSQQLQINKTSAIVGNKVSRVERGQNEKNRHFRIYKCGLAV